MTNMNHFSYQISGDLITDEPHKNSRILFEYFKSIYGKHTLAGQMNLTWNDSVDMLERVYEDTGKYPALQGFDFMNIKGQGSGTGQTEEAISWWKNARGTGKKGIVTFCWHWRDPMKAEDLGEFYSNKTSYRIPYDTERSAWKKDTKEYDALLQDIHIIAAELKKLEDAGVPVLWRPLHEASGGWFWWGDSGLPAYKALWNLLFSELNNRYRLKNLIWVWNGQSKDWYPGDKVVDIIGEDVYAEPRTSLSSADRFIEALAISEQPKMIALSENGVMPDPEAMKKDQIHWLYFMTWNDAHKGKGISDKENFWTGEFHNRNNFKKKVYENDLIITLDDLPVFTEN